MIGLVIVSHSPQIAEGIALLIKEMTPQCPLELAAGIDDIEHPIGTDAVKIMTAVENLKECDGVVILVDLGSAILSAQTALDLLDPEISDKTAIAAAPLVEGSLSAAITSVGGGDINEVIREAAHALESKRKALEIEESTKPVNTLHPSPDAVCATVKVSAKNGLHARPAARLAAIFNNNGVFILEKNGVYANARSLNAITGLKITQGDTITLHVETKDSDHVISQFKALANDNFGDSKDDSDDSCENDENKRLLPSHIRGTVSYLKPLTLPNIPPLSGEKAKETLINKTEQCKNILRSREICAKTQFGESLAEIFSAHAFLLDDLASEVVSSLNKGNRLDRAWQQICEEMIESFQLLSDPYLQARDADIADINIEMVHLFAETPRPIYYADGAIWLVENIFVSQILEIPPHVRAICDKQGNILSHAALCCQSKGIFYYAEWAETVMSVHDGEMGILPI